MFRKVKQLKCLLPFVLQAKKIRQELLGLATEQTCYKDSRILPKNSKSYNNLQNKQNSEYECIKILKHRFNIYQSTKKCICNRVATRSQTEKTYSMNSLVGSNQHESTSSRLYIILYFRCGEMYPLLRNILDVIHVVLLIFS